MTIGTLAALWMYPVKSLAAKPLQEARIEAGGIPGDRERALFVRSGHVREGKTYRGKESNELHRLLNAEAAVSSAAERGVALSVEGASGDHFFDARAISLIFDTWIADVERALNAKLDPRRWRPNLYAHAAAHFSLPEQQLVGATVVVGDTALRVIEPIHRCVTTTYDVDTGEPDARVSRYVANERANVMGVYCEVERAGTVRVGDALRLRAR